MKPRARYRGLTLFVTVGSTKFDKLIDKLLSWSPDSAKQLTHLGFARLLIQAGRSEHDPQQVAQLMKNYNTEIEIYDYKNSIIDDIKAADVVIGHAGAGTCLEVLRLNKRLLIVVNDDLMDNHQNELAEQLSKDNHAIHTTVDELSQNLDLIWKDDTKLDKFQTLFTRWVSKYFQTCSAI